MKILLLFLWCLVYFIQSITTECEELKFQSQVNCYQYFQNCFSLEGDEENYSNVQHIDSNVVQKSFLIPYKQEPILTRIIDSLYKNRIQEKLICSLFLNHEYYISCINFDLVLYKEQSSHNEILRFETKISSQELCFEMYESNDGSLRLFCHDQYTLKNYQVNLLGNITLILEYDASDQISDFCKIQQKSQGQNYLILVFYQCSKWKVLMIQNQDVKIILEAQMKNMETLLQSYSFIQEVSFCEFNEFQWILYLVENFDYLQIHFYSSQNPVDVFSFRNPIRIQKIVILKRCKNIIFINQLEDNRTTIFASQNFLGITLDQQIDTIHFQSDLIFLQDQFELKILIDTQLNQTYQISNTSLHFFQFSNFFCQFDKNMQGLQFYIFNPISSLIKPKKKYIYFISKDDLFRQAPSIKCYKIINSTTALNENQHLAYKVLLQNACSNNLQTRQTLNSFDFIQDLSFNLNNNGGSIKVSIKNYQEIQESCFQKLQRFYFQGNIEFISIKLPRYISIQNQTNFLIYDCKQNQLIININKVEFDVLESNGNIYIFNRIYNHLLRVIKLHNNNSIEQFNVKFDDVIIDIKKIAQNIFLYFKNSMLPLLILQNIEIHTFNQYLLKTLYQNEPILFYAELGSFKVIQYPKLLAIENQGNIQCFKYFEGEIIFIPKFLYIKDCFLLLTIQYFSRSLILSQLNDFEIYQLSNYSFQDYQFSYPLRYKGEVQRLAILIEKNNSLFIAIFQFNYASVDLRDIISTDNQFFILTRYTLLYSSNKQWRYLFLKEIFIDVQTQTSVQSKLQSDYYTQVNPYNEEFRGIDLTISIENVCYQLFPLQNLSIIEIQQNQIINLNISDIFYGPISSLKLLTNSKIKLNGPFKLTKKLKDCIQKISKFCIKRYQFTTFQHRFSFQVVNLENKNLGMRGPLLNDQIIKIFWIKQNYFLSIVYLKKNLHIQLISCSEKEDESCQLKQNVYENLEITQIEYIDIMRTGNLLQLYPRSFIHIWDINFAYVEIQDIYFDISYIEQSQDLYILFLKNDIYQNDLEIKIYQIQLNHTNVIYSSIVTNEFKTEFTRTGNFYKQESTIKFFSCKQIGDEIIIKFFVFNNNENKSYCFLLKLELQQKLVQFQFQNYIRNFLPTAPPQSNFRVDYFDENILILKQDEGNYIKIYDLRQQREFYDYFHSSNDSISIQRINTTHYIFQTHIDIYVGTIGYEIQIEDWDESRYDFDLLAQNEISNTKVSFQIHIIKYHQNYKDILLVQLICFIFIIIYLKNKRTRTRK